MGPLRAQTGMYVSLPMSAQAMKGPSLISPGLGTSVRALDSQVPGPCEENTDEGGLEWNKGSPQVSKCVLCAYSVSSPPPLQGRLVHKKRSRQTRL